MSILNPIASKFVIDTGVAQEVYFCPVGKSHAIVDVSFLKDSFTGTSVISVALTKESNPANLTTVDYFIDDIDLVDEVNSAELNKLIVGSGERLIVKVLQGPAVSIRLSGVEENNPKVLRAGKIVATVVAGTSQTLLYFNELPSVSYVSTSVTMYNPSPTLTAEIDVWISTQAVPTATDKVLKIKITPQDTTIIENILMLHNEKLFVRSNQIDCEYFLVGMVVAV